jgi:hypothetical protein
MFVEGIAIIVQVGLTTINQISVVIKGGLGVTGILANKILRRRFLT